MKVSIGKFTGSKRKKKKIKKSAFCKSLWKTVLQLVLALHLARPRPLKNENALDVYHFRGAQR